MWVVLRLLLCAFCAFPIYCIQQRSCPQIVNQGKNKLTEGNQNSTLNLPLGILVLPPGSNLVLGCSGWAEVDGVEVHITGADKVDSVRTVTGENAAKEREEEYRSPEQTSWAVSHLGYTATADKASPTGAALLPTTTGVVRGATSEGWDVEERGGEDDYTEDEEEGGRVVRGLRRRPQWKLNRRPLRGEEGEEGVEGGGGESVVFGAGGEFLTLSSVGVGDAGNYSCFLRGKMVSSFKVVVAVAPEKPTLSCYKRSPSSKIRCWTSQQPGTTHLQCNLFLSKSLSRSFSHVKCSYSARLRRCWCALPHVDEELRVLHQAYLCVTNAAGSTASSQKDFLPLDILQPDPPSELVVRPVEGQTRRLRVSWTYPHTWKDRDQYYMLQYRLSYRPLPLDKTTEVPTSAKFYVITDALPGVEYVVQLSAKDEFDGLWSDWSTPVHGYTWTAPEPTALNDVATTTWVWPSDYPEGSGMTEEPIEESSDVTEEVWPHVTWVVGCVLLLISLLVAIMFRHKERFISKLVSLSPVKPSSSDSSSPALAPAPQEGRMLVNYESPHYKEPLPQEMEEEEEGPEEDKDHVEEEELAESRKEVFHFNNTSYFMVQTDHP